MLSLLVDDLRWSPVVVDLHWIVFCLWIVPPEIPWQGRPLFWTAGNWCAMAEQLGKLELKEPHEDHEHHQRIAGNDSQEKCFRGAVQQDKQHRNAQNPALCDWSPKIVFCYVWRWGIAHSATVSGSSIDEFASDELLENKFHHVLSRCSVCPNLYGSS